MTENDIISAIQSVIPGAQVKVLELDPWRAKVRIGIKRYLVYWGETEPRHFLFFSVGDLDPGFGGRIEAEGLKARLDRVAREKKQNGA